MTSDADSVCGRHHRAPGLLDESARRLTHQELAVAEMLASEGHWIRSRPEHRGRRSADLDVCGVAVEVKSWLSLEQRDGRPPTARSVLNKLMQADGQARSVVLYAGDSELTLGEAARGLQLYAATSRRQPLANVRIVGDTFDVGWTRRPELPRGVERRRRPPDLGLAM